MRLRSLSLKYKFIITLVCFTALLAVTFGFIVTDRLSQELWKQFKSQGKDLVDTLTSIINPELSTLELLRGNQDVTELLGLLKQHLLQGEYVYFQVVINGQQLYLAQIGGIDPGVFLVEPVPRPFETRPVNLPSGERVIDFKSQLHCGGSLEQPSEDVLLCARPTYVRLGLSPLQVSQELNKAVLLFTMVSATFILVGVLVAFVLYKWVLGPVEVLTSSVKQFGHDRFARAHVHSGDELETLAFEFNTMASTLAEHENHLERVNQELSRANQVKSEFLAIMGHELKTPLHAIRGFSQLLLQGVDGPLTDDQSQDLEAIFSSGNHLLELIDNILRFSKLEAGEEPLHLERVLANEVVGEALQNVESLARNRDLTLQNDTPALPVQADATKLKQILINLLSNAIKYAPSGTITVGACHLEEGVRFSVADTGPGIDPKDAEKVFEPFTQLDGSNTRESSGIGLGLAIVKKYVEMHEGQVWFEPNPAGGTIFRFSLPDTKTLITPDNRVSTNGRRAVSTHKEGR